MIKKVAATYQGDGQSIWVYTQEGLLVIDHTCTWIHACETIYWKGTCNSVGIEEQSHTTV
jgi:hypothetical protein